MASGQATPAPPVGPALAKYQVNIGQFVSQFNERTKSGDGIVVPVVITVYKDKTFEFVIKSSPAAVLLKKAAGIAKGSGIPHKEKVGKVSREQLEEIAKVKMADLNAKDLVGAVRMIEGTARNMGIEVA